MNENMTPEEIQAIVDAYNKALAEGTPISKELANAMRDANAGIRNYSASLSASLSKLGTAAVSAGKGFFDGKSGITAFNEGIDSGAKALEWFVSKIPFVGKALAGMIEAASQYEQAVTKQAQSLFDTYQDISRSGLATGMTDVFNNLQSMGYTMAEIGDMAKVLKENVKELSGFSGTAAQGAQRLSQVSKLIQESDIGTQFKNMGMNVSDINTGIASYIRIQQLNGVTSKQTTEKLAASAEAYIQQQDILTKLTGATAKEQEDIHRQALQTQQYAAKTFLLQQAADRGDAKASAELARNKKLEIEFATRYPEHQKGMLAALAGATNSPEYAEFQMAFPKMAEEMRAGNKTAEEIMNTGNKDAVATLSKGAAYIAAGGKEFFGPVNDLMRGSAMTAEDQAKALKKAQEQQENAKAGVDKQTAEMVKFLQAQRNVTQAIDRFVNAGIDPTVTALTKLATTGDAAAKQIEKLFGKIGEALGLKPTTPGESTAAGGTAAKTSAETTTIKNAQGEVTETRKGGSRNWRNNNPGNIEFSPFAMKYGAIGSDGRFAIFPSMDMGERAQDALLKSKNYAELNLKKSIARWAPASENDPAHYANVIAKESGLDLKKRYIDLTEAEQKKFRELQTRMEGGKAGEIIPKTPVTAPVAAPVPVPVVPSANTRSKQPTTQPVQPAATTPPIAKSTTQPVQPAATTPPIAKPTTAIIQNITIDQIHASPVYKKEYADQIKMFPDDPQGAEQAAQMAARQAIADSTAKPTALKPSKDDANLPSAKFGDVLQGSINGFKALLHGTEAVVPLPDGRSIPVTLTGSMPGERQTAQLNQQIQNLVSAVIRTPMANGSMLSGPKDEFSSTMADNKPILSESATKEEQAQPQSSNQHAQEQTALMTMQIDKLDTLIRTMMSQTDISRKILQRQS